MGAHARSLTICPCKVPHLDGRNVTVHTTAGEVRHGRLKVPMRMLCAEQAGNDLAMYDIRKLLVGTGMNFGGTGSCVSCTVRSQKVKSSNTTLL